MEELGDCPLDFLAHLRQMEYPNFGRILPLEGRLLLRHGCKRVSPEDR